MAKGTHRDTPFRTTIVDAAGKADWLRRKGGDHPGYGELVAPGSTRGLAAREAAEERRRLAAERQAPVPEAYVPIKRRNIHVVGWRLDDDGPLPGGSKRAHQSRPSFQRQIAKPDKVRSARVVRDRNVVRSPQRQVKGSRDSGKPTPSSDAGAAALPLPALPVPVPAERARPTDVTYACREGQQEFRKAIIAAYGQCAVTGCRVEEALEAAHIIPYVDARSNLVTNGLCLRADIHRLYDRNLIQIGADGVVRVDPDILSCYRDIAGASLIQPGDLGERPNPELLAVRHRFLA